MTVDCLLCPSCPTGDAVKQTVHLALYDTLAGGEAGHTIAELRRYGYRVLAVAVGRRPVTSMGGLRVLPDLMRSELRPVGSRMLILPGTEQRTSTDELTGFPRAARAFLAAGVPVAASSGAVLGLAKEGLLDGRAHTGAARFALELSGYAGGADCLHADADAVTDGDLITASPTAPEAFAREILARLGLFGAETVDSWFRLYAHSDAAAYKVLASGARA